MSSPSAETPLLGGTSRKPQIRTTSPGRVGKAKHYISPAISRRLFISHFLSTWNSRVFEFGAVLFLASIFPKTLLPMSVYALARGASAIVFSPAVGRYIDTGNRLQVVRFSIVVQRIVVAASCVIFWLLATGWPMTRTVRTINLILLITLACVEKLCSIMNLVSVERDWVVVIAENKSSLQVLNPQMRRIDLFCKLVGPLAIALIDGVSTEIAILVTLGLNVASVVVEYYAIARVYKMVPALQRSAAGNEAPQLTSANPNLSHQSSRYPVIWIQLVLKGLSFYFRHPTVLPSISASLLYFTVLSFAGQMVTYLLSVGYTSKHIGIARTVSVMFEISATWIAPKVMARIGPIRSGIWFLSWQMLCLTIAASFFWGAEQSLVAASGLVGGVILSRVGLRGFDLSAQIIVQEEVDPDHRGSFSSLEASFQNAFGLCAYTSTIVFSKPEGFKWPVLMSSVAVFTAGGLYTVFVRKRRGHLLHIPRCIDPKKRRRSPELNYERLSRSSNV